MRLLWVPATYIAVLAWHLSSCSAPQHWDQGTRPPISEAPTRDASGPDASNRRTSERRRAEAKREKPTPREDKRASRTKPKPKPHAKAKAKAKPHAKPTKSEPAPRVTETQPRDRAEPTRDRAATREPPLGLLRIGSWNLRRLGHGDKRVDLVAGTIEDSFDVVALQEVMDREAVISLLDLLPGWRAEISPDAVGRGGYSEFYAVLYRSDYVVAERSFTFDDAGDRLMREPFVACLRAMDFDFCLVTVHIVFGERVAERDREIDALAPMLERARASGREKDWIVVGDFNRQPGAPGWKRVHASGWGFTSPERIATSLGKKRYASAYDHMLVDPRHTQELARPVVRVDLVRSACAGDFGFCRSAVSDHAPVVASFRVDGDDD